MDAEAFRLLDEWIAVERYETRPWGNRTEEARERYRELKLQLESRVIAIGRAADHPATEPVTPRCVHVFAISGVVCGERMDSVRHTTPPFPGSGDVFHPFAEPVAQHPTADPSTVQPTSHIWARYDTGDPELDRIRWCNVCEIHEIEAASRCPGRPTANVDTLASEIAVAAAGLQSASDIREVTVLILRREAQAIAAWNCRAHPTVNVEEIAQSRAIFTELVRIYDENQILIDDGERVRFGTAFRQCIERARRLLCR